MKISIITATFNRGHFIESCFLSILRQDIKDVELIIIDCLSTDSTFEKLRPLIKKNKNIKFYSETDSGIYDALNKGIDKTNELKSNELQNASNLVITSDIEDLYCVDFFIENQ